MKITEATKIGNLEVCNSGYSREGYPGFVVSLYSKTGEELASVLFEVDQTEDPVCKIHIWDTTSDDPICSMHSISLSDESLELEEYN